MAKVQSLPSDGGAEQRSAALAGTLAHLRVMLDVRRQIRPDAAVAYLGAEDFVLRHGLVFGQPVKTPLKLGMIKGCFANAANVAIYDDRYTYCEGFAVSQASYPFPVLHAWLADRDGALHEVTWSRRRNNFHPGSAAYIGVPFDREYVRAQVVQYRTWIAMLDNYQSRHRLLIEPAEAERAIAAVDWPLQKAIEQP